MNKKITQKLNNLISKIILLLEQDITELGIGDIKMKKDISSILGRLINLIIQLNKIRNDEGELELEKLNKKDLEILENFIEKYR